MRSILGMAGMGQDALVLRVTELLETTKRLDKLKADLTAELAEQTEARESTRRVFNDELMAVQLRRDEAEAEMASRGTARETQDDQPGVRADLVEELRREVKEERQRGEEAASAMSREIDTLGQELAQREQQIRLAGEESRAAAARTARLDDPSAELGLDAIAQARARSSSLSQVVAELRAAHALAGKQADMLKARHEEVQREGVEADAARAAIEVALRSQSQEHKAGLLSAGQRFDNARAHCSRLRGDMQQRARTCYAERLARQELCERSVQTRFQPSRAQLREQLWHLSLELEHMRRGAAA